VKFFVAGQRFPTHSSDVPRKIDVLFLGWLECAEFYYFRRTQANSFFGVTGRLSLKIAVLTQAKENGDALPLLLLDFSPKPVQ